MTCLRTNSDADGGQGIEEDHGFGAEQAVLRAAEAERVDARIDRERAQRSRCRAECRRGVGDPRAVEVDEHPHPVGLVAEGGDLVGGVEGAELGGLGERHHPGLRVVLHPLQVDELGELLGHELGVGRRQIEELRRRAPARVRPSRRR